MYKGHLKKMRSHLDTSDPSSVVEYYLPLGEQEIPMNQHLGKKIQLSYTGEIRCNACDRKTNKSFSQGFCYPCMKSLARCDMCIMKPETCHYEQGTCREPNWAEEHCFVPHYVYLSNTSGLKVGITRHNQIPTRWIDQGATQGLIIYRVDSRQQSGMVEMAFKGLIADKTNWRTMLKENQQDRDLKAEAESLKSQLASKLDLIVGDFSPQCIESLENQITKINYPVLEFPTKIKSHNFDKTPIVEGTLIGIKGQYLIFDTGVINIRKFTSYNVEMKSL